MTIDAFLYSVLSSILAALIYSLFLSGREDRIRSFFANARSGWRRRRYVRIFVGALRGEARAGDTRALTQLLALFPVVMIILTGGMSLLTSSYLTQVNRVSDSLQQVGKPAEKAPQKTYTELAAQAAQLKAQITRMQRYEAAFAYGSTAWLYWLLLVRQPFFTLRSRFAYELDRFTLRIQGLASKAELAELARLEARVIGEATAREYVAKMRSIAERYDVEHLVSTFELWDEPHPREIELAAGLQPRQ